jgi:predicted nucleotidyltransferase
MKNNINKKIKDKLFSKEFTEFCVKSNIKLALLFGSQVSGKAGHDSDFDIAVLLDNKIKSKLELGKLKREMIKNMLLFFETSKIDVVLLNDASPFLKLHIARKGKILYQKKAGDFAAFSSLALRQHEDSRLFYELEDIYLRS